MTTTTSVHSNAFNFMSFLQNGVDPRTGQYTVNIALPDVKSNGLRGPDVPLNLAYNPLNTQDNGYGRGWSLQLSEYDPGRQILSLSTGETFQVTGSNGDRLLMEEQKIDSFHFYKESDECYRVMHKSGQVEILKVRGNAQRSVALAVRIFEPSGHAITLDYVPFSNTHQRLSSIKDDQGSTLLEIERTDTSIDYQLHLDVNAEGGPLASFVMTLIGSDKRVSAITLPTENAASWRLEYEEILDHICLTSVHTPTGAHEQILYLDNGHVFPTSSNREPLPRVTRHITRPGSGQPEIDVCYTYEHEEGGRRVQHSFVGSGLSIDWTNDGRDNLYRYEGEYNYTSTESLYVDGAADPVRSIERRFNQFHLLTREVTTQGGNIKTVETRYNLKPETRFKDQSNTCQLPHEIETTWRLQNDPTRVRSESETRSYDDVGNLLVQKSANGVTETSTWYPASGGEGCPADPEGFVRQIKDQTVTAAPSAHGQAPTLVTRYRYVALPAVQGSGLENWLVTESETLVQTSPGSEQPLQSTVFNYIDNREVPFQHGRVASQVVTMGGQATTTAYVYSTLADLESGESVQRTMQTLIGFDGQKKEIMLEHSLFTGEPLLNRDDNDVEIRYLYDNLRRVLRETVAPGTEYEAYRRYEYYLCASVNDQAQQWLFDVKGVRTSTRFDGLNRAIYEERDDADNPLRVQAPRQTYAAVYDALGNLVEETQYDWLDIEAANGSLDLQQLPLTSRFDYDNWGNQRCVTGPDGVKTFDEVDPIGSQDSQGPIQRSWSEGSGAEAATSGVTETWLNLFEKPTRIERCGRDGKPVSLVRNHYDGLGRTVEEIAGFPDRERKTLNTYDAFDRMIATTLPDTAIVCRTYATHSSEDLPTSISVEHNAKLDLLGEQAFDGLDRMTRSSTGGRERLLSYEAGQPQPNTVTTPAGEVIGYEYLPQLGDEPMQRRLPSATANYEYDPQNARLLNCLEQDEKLTLEYYSTGELKSERRTTAGDEYTMHYRYSRLGRLQSYTDVLGQEQTYEFDSAGRLQKTVLGTTTSDFTYDSLGRTASITTTDSASGSTVGIDLQYDDFGREILRTFDLDGVEQRLAQAYDDTDNAIRRSLTENEAVIRDEEYGYDLRGRLVSYTCKGTQPPVDPAGNAITRQLFSFDALDNLKAAVTSFDGGNNRALYFYEGDDPVQLSRVTNYPAEQGYPAEITLVYDADGNLISDEAGRTLKYDALGRLIEVGTDPAGSRYRYDPLDKLTSETRNSEQDQCFYRDGELANQVKGNQNSTFMRGDNHLLAERQGDNALLLGVNDKNSVLNEISAGAANASTYSPYGQRSNERPAVGKLGFNGELYEADTGWQLLGGGYRAYNPLLMRFHSPDSLSPFGEGGMNAYAYCEGDPVNFVDPTGHGLFTPLKLLLRVIKPVVMSNSKKAADVPSLLKTVPSGKEATRLYKIKKPFVNRLKQVAEYRQKLASKPTVSGSNIAERNRQLTNLVEQSQDAREAYTYAAENVGKDGVSRYAKNIVNSEWNALVKDAVDANRKARAAYATRSGKPGEHHTRTVFEVRGTRDRFGYNV